MATVPGKRSLGDPNLRDRLYALLEHDHLPYSFGSRFIRLIALIIVLDVLAMIFASVPEIDARFGPLFTAIEIVAVVVFGLEYFARVKRVSPLPVCAGFGIRSREQVERLAPHVDGVVVASALVEVQERGGDPAEFLRSLR